MKKRIFSRAAWLRTCCRVLQWRACVREEVMCAICSACRSRIWTQEDTKTRREKVLAVGQIATRVGAVVAWVYAIHTWVDLMWSGSGRGQSQIFFVDIAALLSILAIAGWALRRSGNSRDIPVNDRKSFGTVVQKLMDRTLGALELTNITWGLPLAHSGSKGALQVTRKG